MTTCSKCGRVRATFLSTTECGQGGYCDWGGSSAVMRIKQVGESTIMLDDAGFVPPQRVRITVMSQELNGAVLRLEIVREDKVTGEIITHVDTLRDLLRWLERP